MIGRLHNALGRLNLNCRESARLISESNDRELSWPDRLGLRLHLCICGACRAYRHSILILREMMRRSGQIPFSDDSEGLPDAARDRILEKLQRP